MEDTNKKVYRIIGMMSGTSLDGVDLSFCEYYFKNKWNFNLIAAKTYPYQSNIIDSINAMQNPMTTFLNFKKEELTYTEFICLLIQTFINQFSLTNIDYICLHGHTIFHHPEQKITIQITNLALVAARTSIDVIGNFRELDVMRGGYGAPLAPFGEDLFQGDVFINFGGVANIGCKAYGWDINFCNMFFNHFAKKVEGKDYDQEGTIGKKGSFDQLVYNILQEKWAKTQQKSLQRQQFQSLLNQLQDTFHKTPASNLMRTFYHFLANQIVKSIQIISLKTKLVPRQEKIAVVCSGGGAKNTFLIELIQQKVSNQNYIIKVAPDDILQFKEAIIFGFLGVKFLQGIDNCSSGIGGTLVKGRKNH